MASNKPKIAEIDDFSISKPNAIAISADGANLLVACDSEIELYKVDGEKFTKEKTFPTGNDEEGKLGHKAEVVKMVWTTPSSFYSIDWDSVELDFHLEQGGPKRAGKKAFNDGAETCVIKAAAIDSANTLRAVAATQYWPEDDEGESSDKDGHFLKIMNHAKWASGEESVSLDAKFDVKIDALAFQPSTTTLAFALGGLVHLQTLVMEGDGKIKATLLDHKFQINDDLGCTSLSWSVDGQFLAAGGPNAAIVVKAQEGSFAMHAKCATMGPLNFTGFINNTHWITLGEDDGLIKMWEIPADAVPVPQENAAKELPYRTNGTHGDISAGGKLMVVFDGNVSIPTQHREKASAYYITAGGGGN